MAWPAAEGGRVSRDPHADVRIRIVAGRTVVSLRGIAATRLPYFVAKAVGVGAGRVVAITYEYGNTFVIAAGLLNMLVVLDAFDIAKGRK